MGATGPRPHGGNSARKADRNSSVEVCRGLDTCMHTHTRTHTCTAMLTHSQVHARTLNVNLMLVMTVAGWQK